MQDMFTIDVLGLETHHTAGYVKSTLKKVDQQNTKSILGRQTQHSISSAANKHRGEENVSYTQMEFKKHIYHLESSVTCTKKRECNPSALKSHNGKWYMLQNTITS